MSNITFNHLLQEVNLKIDDLPHTTIKTKGYKVSMEVRGNKQYEWGHSTVEQAIKTWDILNNKIEVLKANHKVKSMLKDLGEVLKDE